MTGAWIAAAFLCDRRFGDPARWHPVAGFGRAAARLEATMWRPTRQAGALFAAILTCVVVVSVRAIERRLPARARDAFAALVLWSVLGGRSLERSAMALGEAVERGDLHLARAIAPALVGRDPSALDREGLLRGAVESVAENTSDAVVASLLWAALAGPAGAAGHRAVNTLDAMVGHRSPRHSRFGSPAARADDALNWPAARLTVLLTAACAPVVGGRPWTVVRAALRDGRAHPSPNAGIVEAAFASALAVQLGGLTRYAHGAEHRPILGEGRAPGRAELERAVRLAFAVDVAAALLAIAIRRRR
jgi:adenosylcobinamide-phosphate synthase